MRPRIKAHDVRRASAAPVRISGLECSGVQRSPPRSQAFAHRCSARCWCTYAQIVWLTGTAVAAGLLFGAGQYGLASCKALGSAVFSQRPRAGRSRRRPVLLEACYNERRGPRPPPGTGRRRRAGGRRPPPTTPRTGPNGLDGRPCHDAIDAQAKYKTVQFPKMRSYSSRPEGASRPRSRAGFLFSFCT